MTEAISLNRDWQFRPVEPGADWQAIALPHTPFMADLDGRQHWFGECDYRRTLHFASLTPDSRYVLAIGAAMHSARIFIDDQEIGQHEGGYLPFEIDLTVFLKAGTSHTLRLRLDNRDHPDIPPGKPYADLDFCWYGGLYRGAELRIYPALHITDPITANVVAGGGVFIRTLKADTQAAAVSVQTHVRNTSAGPRRYVVSVEFNHGHRTVASAKSALLDLAAGQSAHTSVELAFTSPALWSTSAPQLHTAHITVCSPEGTVLDQRVVTYGLRHINFSRSGGFQLNGQRVRLRGTNRHQEYPYIGYTASRAAQYRDARRIKEAGFDYVRLSHYPQSPDFLDACDQLGIVVMNAIPGWQYIGGDAFQAACFRNARELIRRDRNHACCVLWELSLNETQMPEPFMAELHAIGHTEYPGDQLYTCGWMDRYDVFIHSRQHGEIHTWKHDDRAHIVAEYGDWEFYAANHGFDQTTGAGVHAEWSNSRKLRRSGERGLRQQAANHTLALNDTLASPAVLDGQWSVFDYARGYHPERAACGVMDIFRLPKFSYFFYRSQRSPLDTGAGWQGGPMVFIASHWLKSSDLRVLIFSNCEEVELRLNDRSISRQRPSIATHTQYLPHPPFVFDLPSFEAGTLSAIGFIGGAPCATHVVRTPGPAAQLEIAFDTMELHPSLGETDQVITHVHLLDASGTLCIEDSSTVSFKIEGDATLAGPVYINTEAGIASTVVRIPAGTTRFTLHASRLHETGNFTTHRTWSAPA